MNKFNVVYVSLFIAFSNVEYGMYNKVEECKIISNGVVYSVFNSDKDSDEVIYSVINRDDQGSKVKQEDSFSSGKTVKCKRNIIIPKQDIFNTITDGFVSNEQALEEENARLKNKVNQYELLAKLAFKNNELFYTKKMKEMLRKNCDMSFAMKNLRELSSFYQQKCEGGAQELDAKNNTIGILHNCIRSLLNEKKQLQDNLKLMQDDLDLKNKQNAKVAECMRTLIDNMSKLSEKQNNKNKMYEYCIARLRSLRIQEEQEKNEIQAQYLNCTEQNKLMQDQITQLENNNNNLKSKYITQLENNNNLKSKYIKLLTKNRIEERKKTTKEVNNRVIEKQDEIKNFYKAKYESVKLAYNYLESEYHNVNFQNKQLEDANLFFKNENLALQNEENKLIKKGLRDNNFQKNFREKMSTMRNYIKNTEKENTEIKNNNLKLLKNKQDEINKLEAKINM